MNRRVVGSALVGFGVFLLALAAGLVFVLAPSLRKIPYDMKGNLSSTEAEDATFVQLRMAGQVPELSIQHADLRVQTGVQPNAAATADLPADLAGRAVVWNVLQQTERADTGEVINAAQSRIAVDRTTASGVNWSGQCLADEPFENCTDGNVSFEGQLYQFPFGTKKQTHEFFDLNLLRAVPLEYRGTDTTHGLRAYRFEQVIPEQALPSSPATISALVGRFAPGATTAKMMYRCKRTVWVEPVSGVIVGVNDVQHHTLVPDVGEPTVIFDATFHLSDETTRAVVKDATDGRRQILALQRDVPAGLALLGLLGIAAGLWMIRRVPRPAPAREPDVDADRPFEDDTPTVPIRG